MTITMGSVRENHVVEFEEGRLIAWRPSEPGQRAAGSPVAMAAGTARRRHARWSPTPTTGRELTDEKRLPIARATTADKLQASIDRLAELAERS